MDSFGTQLKTQREKRKITLDDVSASTKISNRFLSALETDRFDQLPGGIFNKGFVRAYARYLGLDEDQAVADYLAASGDDDPNVPVEVAPAQKVWAEQREQSSVDLRIPWKELAGALSIVVAGLALWAFRSREFQHPTKPEMVAAAGSPAAGRVSSANVVPSTTPVSAAAREEAPLGASPLEHIVFQLRIVAGEDSWISVSGEKGEIFHEILTPPDQKSITARGPITVKVGNARGVNLFFNGRPVPIQGKEGEVKILVFDGNGLRPPAVPLNPQ